MQERVEPYHKRPGRPPKNGPNPFIHRVSYTDNLTSPPLYTANCRCGWTSEGSPDFMKIERLGKSHIREFTR